jgi:hypothetical protein
VAPVGVAFTRKSIAPGKGHVLNGNRYEQDKRKSLKTTVLRLPKNSEVGSFRWSESPSWLFFSSIIIIRRRNMSTHKIKTKNKRITVTRFVSIRENFVYV